MPKQDVLSRNELELLTRKELANLLKVGISSLDQISIDFLPRVYIGKSVRFRLSSVNEFLRQKEKKEGKNE